MDSLLSSEAFRELLQAHPRELIVSALQDELSSMRAALAAGHAGDVQDSGSMAARVALRVRTIVDGTLRPLLNATGVVLHTNLGRAPLARSAIEAMASLASGYSTLEYDLDTGRRGSRYNHCRDLLCYLTGADDALIVNNNAAAVVLALNTLSRGRETVISRGELVEIGGAFRIPDIMERSGARLREVGSTNRTHIDDYREAVTANTGALLKVHPSNFTIQGFVAEVDVRQLAGLARKEAVPLVHDVGSGLMLPPDVLGLQEAEPRAAESLRDGASVVTMSGDKLLGGPQCGIIVGSGDLVERMRSNPLCRALRVDKLTIAALAATLRLYLDPARALREIPVLRMISMPSTTIADRARSLAEACRGAGIDAVLQEHRSAVGGGAAPSTTLHTTLVLLAPREPRAVELEQRLRRGSPGVIARIVGDAVALDLRTIPQDRDDDVIAAVLAAARP